MTLRTKRKIQSPTQLVERSVVEECRPSGLEDVGMFVLVVSAEVKPNAGGAFASAFEERLLSSLRGQRGFRDELLLLVPGGPDMMAITFWDSRDDLDSYERNVWPALAKALANVIERPVLRRFQLAHSTFHPQSAAAFPVQSPITTDPTGVGA